MLHKSLQLPARAIILALIALCVLPASAAKKEITCNIAAGFGGEMPRSGRLVPVYVQINNAAENTQGLITVIQREGSSYEVRHVLPFESPGGSKKLYQVLVRKENNRAMEVRVDFDGKYKTIAKDNFPRSIKQDMVVCVGVPQAYMRQFSPNPENPYKFIRVLESHLPDDPLAYDSVHAVLISGAKLSELPRRQVSAIRDWMMTGGRVIVVNPVQESTFTTAFESLSQGDIDPFRTGVFHRGAGYLACGGKLEQEEPFWLSRGKPLPISAGIFPKLIRHVEEEVYGYPTENGLLNSLVPTGGSYGLSGFLWLALIIAAYIAVIGPIDWYVCKKTGKPHLTWVIFLGAIIGFSFLAYWYSTLVHSGSMQAIYVNVLDVGEGYSSARGNSAFWLYSTKNRTYDINTPQDGTVFSARESPAGSSGVAKVGVVHGVEPRMDARIPIFSSKYFDAAWQTTLDKPYQVSMTNGAVQFDQIPEGHKVSMAYMADSQGLTPMTLKDQKWIPGNTQPWQRVLEDATNSLPNSAYGYGYHNSRNTMPDQALLIRYVQFLSFAHLPKPEVKDESDTDNEADLFNNNNGYNNSYNALAQLKSNIDGREKILNTMPSLAHGGRILLLVLAEDSDLLPISFTNSPVEVARMDVVRLHLPPAR